MMKRRRRYEGAADQEGLPAFLSLSPREEKSRSKERKRTRSRGGGGRTPIQGSTRPVGMECRYKSSPPRLLTSPPSLSSLPSPHRTLLLLLLLLRLSSASTADRDVAHRIITVFYLSTGFTIYYYCAFLLELPLRAATALLYYYYYHHCFRPLPLLLCCCCSYYYIYTISLLFADVLFILLLTPINLDYYVSIWIMQP